MKKCCLILVFALVLTGCAAAPTFETLGDVNAAPAIREEREVRVSVPEGAQALRGATGTIYLCEGYEVTVEVLSGGNLSGTFESLTGFGTDDLTVIETAAGEVSRYECVWSAAGEGGDTVGRAVVLDDGIYHYCVTVSANADDAPALQETWKEIFDSFRLV